MSLFVHDALLSDWPARLVDFDRIGSPPPRVKANILWQVNRLPFPRIQPDGRRKCLFCLFVQNASVNGGAVMSERGRRVS